MKNNLSLWIGTLVILMIFVFSQVVVIVRQGESAVITTLGNPTREITEPGRSLKWPWPIQRLYTFDSRTRTLQTRFEEGQTRDGKSVLIGLFATWKISQPEKFLRRVDSAEQAESKLDGLLRAARSSLLGQYNFSNLVNTDPTQVKLDKFETAILDQVKEQANERYGIEIQRVGIQRTGLAESITMSVFDRIRAERQQLAERYSSEGESEAAILLAQAEAEKQQRLDLARAEAKRLRGEADAEAVEQYKVFNQDPEFANLLRNLDSLVKSSARKTTIILSTEDGPFKYLRNSKEKAAPETSPRTAAP